VTGIGVEAGAQAARARALAVLRIRSRVLAVALLPAAVAVVLLAGGSTGRLTGPGWDTARWAVGVLALLVLLAAGGFALVVARARPAVSPTVPIAEEAAPDLYRLVRDLADRLDVPAPSAIALTPDCDSWLEDRTHPAHGPPPPEDPDLPPGPGRRAHRRPPAAPVLVIGSPFLWWMRVGELRAVLAPVVAGTGPSAHPDIAAARRFVRGLDAAVAVASASGRGPLTRLPGAGAAWLARLLLRGCREHAAEMERGVAAAAAERAQAVDYGLRIVAQEQVGLAYAGWDRLLTRVALPAWRMGRWPSRLDAGVVAALTELSRRDRLAEGFASRLGERPACDLLEEPGAVDEAASLLAARLFHGGPAEPGPDWSPVDWQEYPEEVVDRKWRTDAARLHRVLDTLGVRRTAPGAHGPTLARVLDHLTDETPHREAPGRTEESPTGVGEALGRAGESPAGVGEALGRAGESSAGVGEALGRAGESPASPGQAQGPDESLARTGEPHRPADESPARTGDLPASAGESPAYAADSPAVAAERRTYAAESPAPAAEPPAPVAPADAAQAQAAATPAAEPLTPADPPQAHTATPQPRAPQALTTESPPPHTDESPIPTDGPYGPADDPTDPTDPGAPEPLGDPDTAETPDPVDPLGAFGTLGTFDDHPAPSPRCTALAAGLSEELTREEETAAPAAAPAPSVTTPDTPLWDDGSLPLFPLQPPRTPREVLADHITAMVCCAAMDTAGATPGLDWLDGPSLLVKGERAADLGPKVLSLIEYGDPAPLRAWLTEIGIRPEKPVRLV